MRRDVGVLLVLPLLGGCGRVSFDALDASPAGLIDAADADVVPACPPTAFQPPENVRGVNSTSWEFSPGVSSDGLEMFFHSARPGSLGSDDIWVARRDATDSPFEPPVVSGISTAGPEGAPSITLDGLTLFFASDRAGTLGDSDVWTSTRVDRALPFTDAINVTEVNSPSRETGPSITPDGLTLILTSDRAGGVGGRDLWIATRPDRSSAFSAPVNLSSVNTPTDESGGVLHPNGRALYLTVDVPDTNSDVWVATRPEPTGPFSPPVRVDAVNSPDPDFSPAFGEDGKLYFTSSRPGGVGGGDIWVAATDCP